MVKSTPILTQSFSDAILFATPIHTRVGTAGIFCVTVTQLQLSHEEVQAISDVLQGSLPNGCVLDQYDGQHWRCALQQKANLRTSPVRHIEGKELRPFVPTGQDAPQWKAVAAEMEMALYDHPVNQQRHAAQRPTIDSIWFWQPNWWQRVTGKT